MMKFVAFFSNLVEQQGLSADLDQFKAANVLGTVHDTLKNDATKQVSLVSALAKLLPGTKEDHIKGCYLWGGVGRGKTFLMDVFFNSLEYEGKARYHFNHFMQLVHAKLSEFKGKKDPLKLVAKAMRERCRVICLDEFHVEDITDAMLLYGLLDEFYRRGIVMVMTSNIHPDDLYKNGLQRSRFLPAIELINRYNHVVNLEGGKDYRLGKESENETYLAPLSMDTDNVLAAKFSELADGEIKEDENIIINRRSIPTRMLSDNVVWFEFEDICGGPRAVADYIEIAKQYESVVISNVYEMDENYDDIARRFIHLIDEFYDRDIHLVVSATRLPAYLYSGNRLNFEFDRTISRLEEMRTKNFQNATQKDLTSKNVVSSFS